MAEADIKDVLSESVPALGGRIYPLKLPQNVVHPAVVYQRISAPRLSAFGRDVTAVAATIQVDVYGDEEKGYEAFADVADAVRMALQRLGTGPTPPVTILDTFIDAERDDYEENTKLFRKSFDIRAWYQGDVDDSKHGKRCADP